MPAGMQTGTPGVAPPFRLRPQPPRNIQVQTGTMEVLLSWNMPADLRGVDGFRVYQDTESNLVFETKDLGARQIRIKMEAAKTRLFFVSCVSRLGRESVKMPKLGSSDSNKYVVTGTTGETVGTTGTPYSEWFKEKSGGRRDWRYYL